MGGPPVGSGFAEDDFTLAYASNPEHKVLRPVRILCASGLLLCARYIRDGEIDYVRVAEDEIAGGLAAAGELIPDEYKWTLQAGTRCPDCNRVIPRLLASRAARPARIQTKDRQPATAPDVISVRAIAGLGGGIL